MGEKSRLIAEGAVHEGMDKSRVHSFSDTEEAADFISTCAKIGDVILVKGSRGMRMEYIAERLLKN